MQSKSSLINHLRNLDEGHPLLAEVEALIAGFEPPYVPGSPTPVMRKPDEPQMVGDSINPAFLVELRDIAIEYNTAYQNYYGIQWPKFGDQVALINTMAKQAGVDLASYAPEVLSLSDINEVDDVFAASADQLTQLENRILNSHEVGLSKLPFAARKRWAKTLRKARRLQDWCRKPVPEAKRKARADVKDVWRFLHPLRYMLYVERSHLMSSDGSLQLMEMPDHLVIACLVMKMAEAHAESHGIQGVLIIIPPRHGKTTLVISDIALDINLHPWTNNGIVHHNSKHAKRRYEAVRTHFNNDTDVGRRRRALFPNVAIERATANSERFFVTVNGKRPNTHQEGNVSPWGVHSQAQGLTFHKLRFDDPSDQKEQQEEGTRERTNAAITSTWLPRLTGRTSFFQYICTRWHPEDFSGVLLGLARKGSINLAYYSLAAGGPEDGFRPIWPEAGYHEDFLRGAYARLGSAQFACNPAEAPVLMADFTEKPISEVRRGDVVIGFTTGACQRESQLVPSKVQEVGSRLAPVYKVTMESGQVIRCTLDHRWLHAGEFVRKRGDFYRPAAVGMPLAQLYATLPELAPSQQLAAAWLGGIFDGEGCVHAHTDCNGGHLSIAQSPSHNPTIHAKIRDVLGCLDFPYTETKQSSQITFGSSWSDRRRFMLVAKTSVKAQEKIPPLLFGCKWIKHRDRVASVALDRTERVYSMQTGTGNYVCWGYASKNCQYQNDPDNPAGRRVKKLVFYDEKQWADPPNRTPEYDRFFNDPATTYYLSADPSGTGTRSSHLAGITYAAFGNLRVQNDSGAEVEVPRLLFLDFWSMHSGQMELAAKIADIVKTRKVDRILVETTSGFHATAEALETVHGINPRIIVRMAPGQGTKLERLLRYAITIESGDARFPGEWITDERGANTLQLNPRWGALAMQILLAGTTKDDNLLDCVRQQLVEVAPLIFSRRHPDQVQNIYQPGSRKEAFYAEIVARKKEERARRNKGRSAVHFFNKTFLSGAYR